MNKNNILALGLAFWAGQALATEPASGRTLAATEGDYFAELPVVLTVSRLAQPLDETPGAVTIIDREMIHLSGARSVPELLRLVPGFQVSDSFELISPLVAYHGDISSFGNQMQVLIDGRSVYASYIVGSVAPGLQTVPVEDVERIEVLRGSNSAAYGARAFLGVINIVTRDPASTRGVKLSLRSGEHGIGDEYARIGWEHENASFRLSAEGRSDHGLTGSTGGARVGNLNLRADLRLSPHDELQLRAGASEQDAGVGEPGVSGNLPRNRHLGLGYVQADWRHALAPDQDLAFNYAHGEERYVDQFRYPVAGPFFGTPIDAGGLARNDTLGAQHTFRWGERLRIVWGAEFRQEAIRSAPLYNTADWLTSNFRRFYGNVEWRLTPALLLNVGAMRENTSIADNTLAPRAMLNWHVTPMHTLRLGVSKAYRPPSMYEARADVRFASTTPPNALFVVTDVSRGRAHAESLVARELGYLGEFRQIGLTADVRIFHEQLADLVRRHEFPLAELKNPQLISLCRTEGVVPCAREFINNADFPIHGYEYQLQLRPWDGTRLIYNHASVYISSADVSAYAAVPKRSDGLTWFHKLPGDVDFSLMYFEATAVPWLDGTVPGPWRRTDARLGKPFRLGGSKAEAALVVQGIGPSYRDYPPGDMKQVFERRAFLTLGLEL